MYKSITAIGYSKLYTLPSYSKSIKKYGFVYNTHKFLYLTKVPKSEMKKRFKEFKDVWIFRSLVATYIFKKS